MAFADDIIVCTKGIENVKEITQQIQNWCTTNRLEVNHKKSGVMQIRKDRRTPSGDEKEINGYPIVQSYEYLGV